MLQSKGTRIHLLPASEQGVGVGSFKALIPGEQLKSSMKKGSEKITVEDGVKGNAGGLSLFISAREQKYHQKWSAPLWGQHNGLPGHTFTW